MLARKYQKNVQNCLFVINVLRKSIENSNERFKQKHDSYMFIEARIKKFRTARRKSQFRRSITSP